METLIMRRRIGGNVVTSPSIIYTASSKLPEVTSYGDGGLHTKMFPRNIISHTFEDGIGTIEFEGSIDYFGSGAFKGCTGLTSINVPDSVQDIYNDNFSGCSNLTTITLPKAIRILSSYVFYNCTKLTSIICNARVAPSVEETTFRNVKTGGILYVPTNNYNYDTWMGTGDYYLGKYSWTKSATL